MYLTRTSLGLVITLFLVRGVILNEAFPAWPCCPAPRPSPMAVAFKTHTDYLSQHVCTLISRYHLSYTVGLEPIQAPFSQFITGINKNKETCFETSRRVANQLKSHVELN